MDFHLDPSTDTPLYLQLEDQIRYALSVGELSPGDRLPSIRGLEQSLGVHRNTVRRAYLELHEEGTLIVRQGQRAEVAPRKQKAPAAATDELGPLAERTLQEAVSRGLDAVMLARHFTRLAARHDERYPRCAFVECSQAQADDLARATGRAWRRRVLGVDLAGLREGGPGLPASVSHVLTTPWHVAEVRVLLGREGPSPLEATVRLADEFHAGARQLAGRSVGLLLRDAESVGGYVELVNRHAEPSGPIRTALVGERAAALELLNSSDGVVFTTNCRPFVERHAPAGLVTRELAYEPEPDGLARLGSLCFPALEE